MGILQRDESIHSDPTERVRVRANRPNIFLILNRRCDISRRQGHHPTKTTPLPIITFCDNDAAITLSVGDTSTKRMKHIATRMHYLLELTARDKALLILHLETKGMIADIGTKPLLPAQFHFLRRFLVWE